MFGRAVITVLFVACALPAAPALGQTFKLSSLLPFKKQAPEVKPFKLTDQAQGKPALFSNGPFTNLLQPRQPGGNGTSPLSNLNEKSKSFFAKTGDSLSRFASNTRDSMKKSESPGWDFRQSKEWWNQKSAEPDLVALQHDLEQLQWSPANPQMPPPLPQPRTARDFQNEPPRHRF